MFKYVCGCLQESGEGGYKVCVRTLWVGWYKVAKTHRMPSVAGHFSQKSQLIIGLFCRK